MLNSSVSSQLNPSTVGLPDTWENRIKLASEYMGISANMVEIILAEYGVTKEPSGLDMLSDEAITPFGDLRKEFCENHDIKLPKLRMAIKYLRGSGNTKYSNNVDNDITILKQKYGLKTKIEDIDPIELLQYYNPEKSNHPVSIALKKMFGDKNVIVFKPDSKTVDIEETANYMADIEQGLPEQETVLVNNALVRVYPIGQLPNKLVEEDPMFEGKPLIRGRSTVNRINWSYIDKQIRQFCRIIIERNEININDKMAIKELLKICNSNDLPINVIASLREVYPEADLEFREKLNKDELPKLTITLQETDGKTNNPFNINRQY